MSKPGLTTPPSARAASPLNTSTGGNGNQLPSLSNTPPPPGEDMQPPQQRDTSTTIITTYAFWWSTWSSTTTYDASRWPSSTTTRSIC